MLAGETVEATTAFDLRDLADAVSAAELEPVLSPPETLRAYEAAAFCRFQPRALFSASGTAIAACFHLGACRLLCWAGCLRATGLLSWPF